MPKILLKISVVLYLLSFPLLAGGTDVEEGSGKLISAPAPAFAPPKNRTELYRAQASREYDSACKTLKKARDLQKSNIKTKTLAHESMMDLFETAARDLSASIKSADGLEAKYTLKAKYELAMLYFEGLVNRRRSQEENDKKAAALFKVIGTPVALYHLELMREQGRVPPKYERLRKIFSFCKFR